MPRLTSGGALNKSLVADKGTMTGFGVQGGLSEKRDFAGLDVHLSLHKCGVRRHRVLRVLATRMPLGAIGVRE